MLFSCKNKSLYIYNTVFFLVLIDLYCTVLSSELKRMLKTNLLYE